MVAKRLDPNDPNVTEKQLRQQRYSHKYNSKPEVKARHKEWSALYREQNRENLRAKKQAAKLKGGGTVWSEQKEVLVSFD
jgi:hypothetical protein